MSVTGNGIVDRDYGLFQSRFIDGSEREGSWPPVPTVHTIDVNSTPVLAIVKSPGKAAFAGINAQKQNQFAEAIPLLEEAIKQDPGDEIALSTLAFCFINTGQTDLAKTALDNTFKVDPENLTAANYLGLYHINRNGRTSRPFVLLNGLPNYRRTTSLPITIWHHWNSNATT